jgi:WD40 repeat protein/serine/threonine protein kinase
MAPEAQYCTQCGFKLPAETPPGACPQCGLRGALSLDSVKTQSVISGHDSSDSSTLGTLPAPFAALRTFGDYELLEEIARGGMGVVYKARQKSLKRIVAVKMILSGQFASKQEVLRFRGEAEAAANLRHPNIVPIYETGEHEGQHFFSMDYIAGRNLAEIVRDGPLPAHRAARYVETIALAIHYAHQQGTLHRDLKPSNVLIDADDQPHITDFGLAKHLHGDFGLTVTGQVLGSPNFMPPEQTGARQAKVGPHSDVYGLGAILYHLLTGRPPFQAETIPEVLRQLREDVPVSARLLNPSVPRDLETICAKCLEKEPAKRYATAQALADELQRFLKGEPILARSVNSLEKTWRWCRRKPLVAGLSAATLALVLTVAIGSPIVALRINHERQNVQQNLYAADMYQAQAAWEGGNVGRARELLELHSPRLGHKEPLGFEWRYLSQLCKGTQLDTWQNQTDFVTCVAFSPDGSKLASGSWDSTVCIREVASRKVLRSWTAHEDYVVALAFSPDGRWLATAGSEDTVKLWDVASGQPGVTRNLHAARLAFSPVGSLLAIATGDPFFSGSGGDVVLWDHQGPGQDRILHDAGSRLAFSIDGLKLATGSSNDTVRIWNVATGLTTAAFTNIAEVTTLAFSPDNRWLAAGTFGEGDITLWDLETGLPKTLSGHQSRVWDVAFSPDGTLLASASADQSIGLWEVPTQQLRARLKGHGGEVMSVAFAPKDQMLASGGQDSTVRLWSLNADQTSEPFADYPGGPAMCLFSAAGKRLFTGTTNHTIEIWEIASRQRLTVLPSADIPLAVYPDDRHLVALGSPFSLQHWDLDKSALERSLPLVAGNSDFNWCQISPKGKWLTACYSDGSVTVWNAKTGQRITTFSAHRQLIYTVAFSADERVLATCSHDKTVNLWEVGTWRLRKTLAGHKNSVFQATFTADGNTVATASADGQVKLWDASTGVSKATLIGHPAPVESIALSPDGRTLATGSHDHTVKLWSWATHREMLTLHNQEVIGFTQFSPDGSTLAAGNRGGYLRLWHLP